MKRFIKYIFVSLSFLFFIVALLSLHNQLKNISYSEIINALKTLSFNRIIIASFLSVLYYLILGGYDIIAFKYINPKTSLKHKDIIFTCFISNILGNNTGCSMLFGGSIRYRLYSLYNISIADVAKVSLFSSATIWTGLLLVGGFVFAFAPVSLKGILDFNFSVRTIGLFFIVTLVSYILFSILRSKPIKLFKWTVTFPNIKIVSLQILVATCDWLVASFVLYALMPIGGISYFALLKIFLISQLLGIISQTPGGIVIFEASITSLLPNSLNSPEVMGGLLAYRAIFYFFPLLIALVLLVSFEIIIFTKKFKKTTKIFGKTVSSFIVQVIAFSSFFVSMIAMFSTSTPFNVSRLKFVLSLLPIWIADLSHFLLSIVALGLLFISRALQLRIKSAWKIACILINFAIVFVVVTGESYFVLLCFVVLLIALLTSKKYFYRNISVLNTAFSTWWFNAVIVVFVLSIWIGFFVNKQTVFHLMRLNVLFEDILGNTTDTARFLRSSIGMGIIIFIVVLEQISRSFLKKTVLFTSDDIKNIIDFSDYTYSFNVLSRDKNCIVNDKKNAFIMYAKSKNSWIALGDPVGGHDNKSKNELLWNFKEIADSASARLAFIGVDHRYVQIYNDIGLDTFKIGQEAKIPLKAFDKESERFKYFCYIEKKIEDAGFGYRVLKAENFEMYKNIFSHINNEWIENVNYVDREFVPGKYDESYMRNMDFAIVEKHNEIYAFSVITKTKNKNEVSSGIVRYAKCDKNIFIYMIFKNILWAKENGYKMFDLGLAYFPSIESEDGVIKYFAKMFMFAEHFNYNLLSLREFKDRFYPMWYNKYIAIYPTKQINVFIRNFMMLISPSVKFSVRDISL
ncbi:MAG: bifunctional lysylphosphatidylglycerol flippase/synthetase MprF [Endomicrobiia bacterium]|nr:MAG: bifunctional lysylphosphatidylglycerol flippase/synthetase MprF [Endomicrobiia bacterium]